MILAIIPARGGSIGIPSKNIKLFTSKSLISWTINSSLNCNLIDKVIVSNEHKETSSISISHGAEVTFRRKKLAERAKFLSKTTKIHHPLEFSHSEIGWNERMPNINAVLGLSQIEDLQKRLINKKDLYLLYMKKMKRIDFADIIENLTNCICNNRLINLKLKHDSNINIVELINYILEKCNSKIIFLRPIWQLISAQKMYKDKPSDEIIVAKEIVSRVISLPSSPQLLEQ